MRPPSSRLRKLETAVAGARCRSSIAASPNPPGGGTFAAIYRVVASIPRGRVATYGQVAAMAGMQGAARTVGWALRALDNERHEGRRIPWHRVVGAGGVISLGETPAGHAQRARLHAEGVEFRNGRVVMTRFAAVRRD